MFKFHRILIIGTILIVALSISACTPTPEDYLSQGNDLFLQSDFESAIEKYTEALNIDTDFTEAYVGRAQAYVERGNDDDALDDLSLAIELGSQDVQAYLARGDIYLGQEEYDLVLEDYQSALELSESEALTYFNETNNFTNLAEGFTKRAEE